MERGRTNEGDAPLPMIFTNGNLTAFAIVAVVVLVAIAAVPYVSGRPGRLDPVTGWRVLSPTERIELARCTGNAAGALSMLAVAAGEDSEEPSLQRAISVLRRELRPIRVAAAPANSAESPAGEELTDRSIPLRRVVDLVRSGSDDVEITRTTEAFFDPHDAADDLDRDAPDGRAMLLRRALRTEPQPVVRFVEVVRGFSAEHRPRAAMRWLLRGFAAHPHSSWLATELFHALIAVGRLDSALAIANQHALTEPGDPEFYRGYAKVAGWRSRADVEADALEGLVARTGDETARKRLLALYVHLRAPERGVIHARALAEQAGEVAQLLDAADSALQLGLPEQAIAIFERLAERSKDPVRWRLRIVEVAQQDMLIDRAIDELEQLVHIDPTGDHDVRLEALYRRTASTEALADLLEWRTHARVTRGGAEQNVVAELHEIVALRCRLGEYPRARALEDGVAALDPTRFAARVDPGRRVELRSLRERVLAMTDGAVASERSIGEVLEDLRPYLARPGFRDLAESLLARFPDDARARDLRLELVDVGRTPMGAVRAAEQLATSYPADVELTRVWAERASWAGASADEVRARERIVELVPDDDDNRSTLIDLLQATADSTVAIPHLEALVARVGLQSKATTELIDLLFAADRFDDATEWLRRLAEDPGATWEDQLVAARELFYRQKFEQSRAFFERVLAVRPSEPEALLRLAQVLAWSNEPAAAAELYSRRLVESEEDAAAVGYELGLVLRAIGDHARAEAVHLDALRELAATDASLSLASRRMFADLLVGLGRTVEALPHLRSLVEETPKDLELVLDYVDALIPAGELDEALRLVGHAKCLAPVEPRVLRTAARIAVEQGDPNHATELLTEALAVTGPDAELLAERSRLHEGQGAWEDALDDARRWHHIGTTDRRQAALAVRRLEDRVARFGAAQVEFREVQDDLALVSSLGGSVRFDGQRLRVSARVAHGTFRGRAAAVGGGLVDLEEDFGWIDLEGYREFGEHGRFGGGVSILAGAPGDSDVGAHLGFRMGSSDPFGRLEIHAYLNELWSDPTAAVALEGRQHGVKLRSYHDLGSRAWISGSARARQLEVRGPSMPRTRDSQIAAEVSVGWRVFSDASSAVADRLRFGRLLDAPTSPFVGFVDGDGPDHDAWLANAWISWQGQRLLGDRAIAGLLPVATRTNFVLAAGRVDRHLAGGLGASLEAFVGSDVERSDAVWGVDLGMSWRPDASTELTVIGGRGEALSRGGSGDTASYHALLQFVVRW